MPLTIGPYVVELAVTLNGPGGALCYPSVAVGDKDVTAEVLGEIAGLRGQYKPYFEGVTEEYAIEHAIGALKPLLERWTRDDRYSR